MPVHYFLMNSALFITRVEVRIKDEAVVLLTGCVCPPESNEVIDSLSFRPIWPREVPH